MNTDYSNEPLKDLINQIMTAMKADFGAQYSKQFQVPKDLGDYKARIYHKFDGKHLGDLADGYEMFVEGHNKYPPNLSQLIEYAEKAEKERMVKSKQAAEIARINALPAPKQTIDCNPAEILADAKSGIEKQKKITTEERAKRLADLLIANKAIINMHFANLRHAKFNPINYKCNYSGCDKLGALSDSVRGEGPWYCATHGRMV